MSTNVIRRVLTGALLIAATTTMAFLGKIAVLFTLVLMGLFVQYELAKMLVTNNRKIDGFCLFFGQILLAIWLVFTQDWFWINIWILLSASTIFAIPHRGSISTQKKLCLLLLFLLYTSRGLACLYWLYNTSLAIFTLVLIATWSSDIFAYLIGRLAGRHLLCPAISKNKTWEGLWAGLAGALLIPGLAGACAKQMQWVSWQHVTHWDMLCISIICAIMAPVGDLCESKLKRIVHVKDSGHVLPGHGGVLDRVDALLPCAIATWTWLCYMGK